MVLAAPAETLLRPADQVKADTVAATTKAERGLDTYLSQTIPDQELLSQITLSDTESGHASYMNISINASVTPEQMLELEQKLNHSLKEHPAFQGKKLETTCEYKQGQLCLQGKIVGLTVRDYLDMIHTLADQQHAHDIHEAHAGDLTVEAHHTHEKMVAAGNNLKALILQDEELRKNQIKLPENFSVTVTSCPGKTPATQALDIRLNGFTDRAQAYPAMGALARAFRRKSRGAAAYISGEPHANDFHLHFDHLLPEAFTHLVDHLAHPIYQVHNPNHEGRIDHSSLLSMQIGNN